METIIIKLNSTCLENPDLDIIYILPERIEAYTMGKIRDNGYDYLSNTEIGIWLETENATEMYKEIIKILSIEKFRENDLAKSVEIFISSQESADLEKCQRVYGVV